MSCSPSSGIAATLWPATRPSFVYSPHAALAAFSLLLDDPLDAAASASRFMLLHGASSEADALSTREEQLRWLRELFEAPAARRKESGPRIDAPWEPTGRSCPDVTGLLRALRGRAHTLVERDPWIPIQEVGLAGMFSSTSACLEHALEELDMERAISATLALLGRNGVGRGKLNQVDARRTQLFYAVYARILTTATLTRFPCSG